MKNPLIENVDFYWCEIDGIRLKIFTEEYLKKTRVICCKSFCKHCPWNYRKKPLINNQRL